MAYFKYLFVILCCTYGIHMWAGELSLIGMPSPAFEVFKNATSLVMRGPTFAEIRQDIEELGKSGRLRSLSILCDGDLRNETFELGHLESLHIDSCVMTSTSLANLVERQKNLKNLTLNQACLEGNVLAEGLGRLSSLRSLSIKGNKLTTNEVANLMRQLPLLEEIYLSHNNTDLKDVQFPPSLKKLECAFCPVSAETTIEICGQCHALQEIWTSTRLTSPQIGILQSMQFESEHSREAIVYHFVRRNT